MDTTEERSDRFAAGLCTGFDNTSTLVGHVYAARIARSRDQVRQSCQLDFLGTIPDLFGFFTR